MSGGGGGGGSGGGGIVSGRRRSTDLRRCWCGHRDLRAITKICGDCRIRWECCSDSIQHRRRRQIVEHIYWHIGRGHDDSALVRYFYLDARADRKACNRLAYREERRGCQLYGH